MKIFFSNISAIALLSLYTSLSVYGVITDVCLQGGEQRFQSVVIGLPCAVGAMVLYCAYGSAISHRWFINILSTLILFPVFKAWAPLLLSASIQGHHLCGREFDNLIETTLVFDRFLPVIHLLTSTTILLLIFSVSFSRMRRGYVMGPFYIE